MSPAANPTKVLKAPKVETEIKKIGNYRAQFSTKFKAKDSDKIFVSMEISDDLRDLIKSVCLQEVMNFDFLIGEGATVVMKRYKVKRWVYSSLNSNYRNCVFSQNLIDTGKDEFAFDDAERLESFLHYAKENLRDVVRIIEKWVNLKQTVVFEMGDK